MFTAPADTPVTTPVLLTTVALAVVPLVQVPPAVTSANVIADPTHTVVAPVIAAGPPFTVTTTVAFDPQPVL